MPSVFPSLLGLTWDQRKRPTWGTIKLVTNAGNEFRTTSRQVPITEFDLRYDYLSPSDKITLEGFFNQMQGAFQPFYFNATNDNTVTTFGFGTGDGSTKSFTLLKPAGTGAVEPIGGPNVISGVFDNGSPAGAYTVNGNVLTFTTAPLATHALTWTGSYYYLVRFLDDELEFNQFANGMYECPSCKLITVQ